MQYNDAQKVLDVIKAKMDETKRNMDRYDAKRKYALNVMCEDGVSHADYVKAKRNADTYVKYYDEYQTEYAVISWIYEECCEAVGVEV